MLLALFSILGGLENVAFLDLFAGTGRVGIEALRRGVSSVVMVEVLKDRAREIEREVAKEFERTKDAVVLSLELRRAIRWLVKRGRLFDVVFADPPYDGGWGSSLLHVKDLPAILKGKGVLVVEHASHEALDVPLFWAATDVRIYGGTALTFLKTKQHEEALS